MKTSPYQLANDVFLCLSGSHFVFLDLRHNQYLCLSRRNTQIAMSVLTCFAENTTARNEERTEEASRVIRALLDSELIADRDEAGSRYTPVSIQAPTHCLLSSDFNRNTAIRASHWAAFLQACLKASAKLRWYSMQHTVQTISNRKSRSAQSQPEDRDPFPDLVATFHRLRPFYAREYLCLYDSLALMEFLAQYSYFPTWVFGVQAEPFNAHCWVQEGNYVLNDLVENVHAYTPIMVVQGQAA